MYNTETQKLILREAMFYITIVGVNHILSSMAIVLQATYFRDYSMAV